MNFNSDKEKQDFCNLTNSNVDDLHYCIDKISLKNEICNEFYKNGKYYLNS